MLLLGMLMAGALSVEGDMKLVLDQATYPGHDSAATVEIGYEVPYTSLSFLKQDTGYLARFMVGVQLLDRAGTPLAGETRQREVRVFDYDLTTARDSNVDGILTLAVPDRATRGLIEVTDMGSDRHARAGFGVVQPRSGVSVRMLKRGGPNPGRSYGLEDTIEALIELPAGLSDESLTIEVKDARKTKLSARVPVADSGGRRTAHWTSVVADSGRRARLASGEYRLEVRDGAVAARADFSVEVPFFTSDEQYKEKVDELLYAATQDKVRELKLVPRDERESAWRAFWKDKDPNPTTEVNEYEETYFERIEYARQHFGGADRGVRSDRGRVYVKLGPPDAVDSRPFEIDSRPYEVWYYYQSSLTFTFIDRYGFGEYLLVSPQSWH